MRVSPVLARWLNRAYGVEFDRSRPDRVYDEYDISRGYAEYHALCRSRFDRTCKVPENALCTAGYEKLDVLEPDYAASILSRLRGDHRLSLIKRDSKDLQGWTVPDERFIRSVLHEIFTAVVDDRLVAFFNSEYLVHWITFTAAMQAEQQRSVSFKWHCDKGPRAHLKLIVYLNATAEHGGSTEFVDIEQTATVAKRGYLFGWSHARTDSLEYLSRRVGRQLHSHAVNMHTGQGVLFQPARVLHRGVSPPGGDRCVITVCLLPSPVPWEIALARGTMSDLAVDASWHDNARQLLDRLGVGGGSSDRS